MANYKTSVIIPVYNTEQYLDECIQSVLNQTQKEVEVLLIDDGSTDGSYEILLSYAERYANVKAYHQENKKLGAARNLGLKHATGEYILFLDSDDYIKEKCLEELYKCAEMNRLDFVTYDSEIFVECMEGEKGYPAYDRSALEIERSRVYRGRDYLNAYYEIGGVFVSACLGYYNTGFLRRNSVSFEEQVYYEDNEFSLKVYYSADRMMYLSEKLYVRRYRENSIMTSEYGIVHLQSALKMSEKCLHFLLKISNPAESMEGVREITATLADLAIKQIKGYKNEADLHNDTYMYSLCIFFVSCDKRALLSNIGLELAYDYYYLFSMIMEKRYLEEMSDVKKLLKERIFLLRRRIEKVINRLLADWGIAGNNDRKIVIYGTGDVAERILNCYKIIYGKSIELERKIIFANTKIDSATVYMERFPIVQIDGIEKYFVSTILIASTKYDREMCTLVDRLYDKKYTYVTYREIANISIDEK